MSEENNIYENNQEEVQYTPAPEVASAQNDTYGQTSSTYYAGNGANVNYGSGKGQGKGPGIASMICGIISLLIGCCGAWYVSVPCALAAIILGIIQLVKNESKGMAIAGIICGAIGLIISILVVVAVVVFMSSGIYNEIYNELMNEMMYEMY